MPRGAYGFARGASRRRPNLLALNGLWDLAQRIDELRISLDDREQPLGATARLQRSIDEIETMSSSVQEQLVLLETGPESAGLKYLDIGKPDFLEVAHGS